MASTTRSWGMVRVSTICVATSRSLTLVVEDSRRSSSKLLVLVDAVALHRDALGHADHVAGADRGLQGAGAAGRRQRRRRVDGVDEREVDDVPVGEGAGRAAVEVEGAHGLVPVRDRDGEQRTDPQVSGARAPRRVAGVGADVTAAQPSAGVGDLDARPLAQGVLEGVGLPRDGVAAGQRLVAARRPDREAHLVGLGDERAHAGDDRERGDGLVRLLLQLGSERREHGQGVVG